MFKKMNTAVANPNKFLVGDIVKPTGDQRLRSGASEYTEAVVISVDPFVLCSKEADMRWSSTVDISKFEQAGVADATVLAKCMLRL